MTRLKLIFIEWLPVLVLGFAILGVLAVTVISLFLLTVMD